MLDHIQDPQFLMDSIKALLQEAQPTFEATYKDNETVIIKNIKTQRAYTVKYVKDDSSQTAELIGLPS